MNSQFKIAQRGRVCIGLAEGGTLTVKSKAGMGVQRFTWIMANTLGRWPSLAPAKNSLAERKAGQPGMAHGPSKDAPSLAQLPHPGPPLPIQEHLHSCQVLLVHTFQPTSQRTTFTNAGAGKPEAVSGYVDGFRGVETLSVVWGS